jgi:hypothetical protein
LRERRIRPIVETASYQQMQPDTASNDPYAPVTLERRQSTLVWLDGLREEWGLRSRTELVNRLLEELAKPSQLRHP